MNGPDGYRLLPPGLDATTDVAQHRVPVEPGTKGLMVSDGFFRLIDTFRTRLRALEVNNPEDQRSPRLKHSDDATAPAFEPVTGARQVG